MLFQYCGFKSFMKDSMEIFNNMYPIKLYDNDYVNLNIFVNA